MKVRLCGREGDLVTLRLDVQSYLLEDGERNIIYTYFCIILAKIYRTFFTFRSENAKYSEIGVVV